MLGGVRREISPRELTRTKEQFKASLVMGLESNSARAASMGRSLLLENRYLSEDDILAKIDALDVGDLRAVADRLLGGRPALSVVGDVRDAAFYEELLKKCEKIF